MTMSLPCVFLWSCGRPYCWRCPIRPNLPLLLTPLSQPHPQRPEPRHVPSPAAPCEQNSQQVHRPGPAGQLHTVPSTLSPPQDPGRRAPDPDEHTSSWLGHTHPPQPGPGLHHRQPAAAPCPTQSLRLLLGPGPGWAHGIFVEPARQLSILQRTPAFWGPRPGPKAVTVPGATEERCHVTARLAQDPPHGPWMHPRALRVLFSMERLPVSI